MKNNLVSCISPIISQRVKSRARSIRFSILPRLIYYLKYGSIDYKICNLIKEIRDKVQDKITLDQIEQAILISATSICLFNSIFNYCK